MNKPIEPGPNDKAKAIPPLPPVDEGQPDEAWVESVIDEGYRVLFGLDGDPDEDLSQGRR